MQTSEAAAATLRKDRRREIVRQCQRRYRERQKVKDEQLVQRLCDLKALLVTWTSYHTLLLTKLIQPPKRHMKIIELFATLFQYGIQNDNKQQKAFLKSTCTEDMTLQCDRSLLKGPDVFYQLWRKITLLYPKFRMEIVTITAVSEYCIRLTVNMTLPIHYRILHLLYPDCLADKDVLICMMNNVVLACKMNIMTTFNTIHQMEHVYMEENMLMAWMEQFEDDVQTVAYIMARKKNMTFLIAAKEEAVLKAISRESGVLARNKRKMNAAAAASAQSSTPATPPVKPASETCVSETSVDVEEKEGNNNGVPVVQNDEWGFMETFLRIIDDTPILPTTTSAFTTTDKTTTDHCERLLHE